MGRYVTPRGVVITLGDVAARAVGYQPAEEPKKAPKKAPTKKSDDKSDDK